MNCSATKDRNSYGPKTRTAQIGGPWTIKPHLHVFPFTLKGTEAASCVSAFKLKVSLELGERIAFNAIHGTGEYPNCTDE